MRKLVLLLIPLLFVIISCAKKVDCENAELCVKNIGTDVIYYCWGCNMFSDSILPGEKACVNVGSVYVSYTTESIHWVDFNSTHGDFVIKVDKCFNEIEIE